MEGISVSLSMLLAEESNGKTNCVKRQANLILYKLIHHLFLKNQFIVFRNYNHIAHTKEEDYQSCLLNYCSTDAFLQQQQLFLMVDRNTFD